MQRHSGQRRERHRHQRYDERRAEQLDRDQEEAHGRERQQRRGHRCQHLPGGESGQRRDARQGVVDRELRLPRGRHLVDRLGDVDAGWIRVLEQVPGPGGDVGIGAGADRSGVVLMEGHGDERHGEDDEGHEDRPGQPRRGQLWPSAGAHGIHGKDRARRQRQRQRGRIRHRSEPEDRQHEAARAGAGREHPQQLVAPQHIGQEDPRQPEAADPEQNPVASSARSVLGTAVSASWRGFVLRCSASAAGPIGISAASASCAGRPRGALSVRRGPAAWPRSAPSTGTPDSRADTASTSVEARSRV